MSAQLDLLDHKLLDLIQREIPLVERPFAAIAEMIGMTEAEVLARLASLRTERRVIRQISAIFDSRALGYQSCLVAARVNADQIDASAAVISGHPGVSHNYRRDHPYNLWYTLAVPPDSRLGLQGTLDVLHELSKSQVTRLMPSLKTYKIGVKFDIAGENDPTARSESSAPQASDPCTELNGRDKTLIRVLQQDLPIIPRPFDAWAAEAGVSVPVLLSAARSYIDLRIMRRFSAVLRHREAGFTANAMGAWVVPFDRADLFGATAASFASVSHCYRRPSYPDWPYSLFTMVHGTSKQECEAVLAEISKQAGITDYIALYSTHEYKKVRVKYFTGDIERWELEHHPAKCLH